jgi:hypothetical protein
MARISSGINSKQDYKTPAELIAACDKRFGLIGLDLAAHSGNHVVSSYIAPCTGPEGPMPFDLDAVAMDTFDQNWSSLYLEHGLLWLNPPFGDIEQFSAKCVLEAQRGARILLLIPYGTTKAFNKNVLDQADIYMLIGRLQFIEGESFPKDCIIAHYTPETITGQFKPEISFWDWKNDKIVSKYRKDV